MALPEELRREFARSPQCYGLPESTRLDRLGVVVIAPPLTSRRGRISYLIRTKGRNALWAQARPLWSPERGPGSPYAPAAPSDDAVRDLLVQPRGVLRSCGREVSWARFLPGSSLSKRTLPEVLECAPLFFARLRETPWLSASPTTEAIAARWAERFRNAESQTPEPLRGWPPASDVIRQGLVGFRHGDLWCGHVFSEPSQGWTLIDWEWSALDMPDLCDLLSFCRSLIAVHCRATVFDSFARLAGGTGRLEDLCRCALAAHFRLRGYDVASARRALVLALAYFQWRVVEQRASGVEVQGDFDYARLLLAPKRRHDPISSLAALVQPGGER